MIANIRSVIKSLKSKDRKTLAKTKAQTMIHKTLQTKDQHEHI